MIFFFFFTEFETFFLPDWKKNQTGFHVFLFFSNSLRKALPSPALIMSYSLRETSIFNTELSSCHTSVSMVH